MLTRLNLCQFCWARFIKESQFSSIRKLKTGQEIISVVSIWSWPPNKCPILSSLLQALKNAKAPTPVFYQLAAQLWDTARFRIQNHSVDAVVSIPGNFQKKDHAWVLASQLSLITGAPHVELLSNLNKNKIEQKHLSPIERAKNPTLVCNTYKANAVKNRDNPRILVVDDIITTGSTLQMAFKTIKTCFPNAKLDGLVVADRPLAVALGL
jgi:predicted amidophosphoribosyltransferase